ncbi:hypothetical protein ACWGI8_28880 [Streptomyces sp. NPDC054841]
MSGTTDIIAVVTNRAQQRVKTYGTVAEDAVEALRRELERAPRIGVLVRMQGNVEVYKTRVEGREGMPGLAVAYVYTPQPPPQTIAIVSVVPDEVPRGDD